MARLRMNPVPKPVHLPWWLGGDEECPHCGQLYAWEAQSRCVGCDAPACPLCIVRARHEALCPDCAPREP
jgi:hypothetical protein